MSKKYLQLPRFQTHQPKKDAVALVERHVNKNISDFKDGEEVSIEYAGPDGQQMCSIAVVQIRDGAAKLFVSIEENESLRIFESDSEPSDKDVLWLSDYSDEDESGETSNIRQELIDLRKAFKELKETVNRHDYALSSTIAGGDIVTNSEKYGLENSSTPEPPEDAPDLDVYTEDDFVVTSFDLYIGNSTLSTYNKIYKGQNYFLKLRMFNNAKERVPYSGETLTIECTPSEIATVDENDVLYATTAGTIQIIATLVTKEGRRLREIYQLNVEWNEEPDYATYSEPNVKHLTIKTVQTLDILLENIDYLCLYEPIWCIGNSTLYIKAKSPNGLIRLYKINGDGGSIDPPSPDTGDTPDTGITEETTFEVIENVLTITSTNDAVRVDENGILIFDVGKVENNILILDDLIITGDTPDTGETQDSSTAVIDPDDSMSIGGKTEIDGFGTLSLNATVTPDGILEITS